MKWLIRGAGLLAVVGAFGCTTRKLDYFSRFPVDAYKVSIVQRDGGQWLKIDATPIVSDIHFMDYVVEYPGAHGVVVTMKGRSAFWGTPARSEFNPHIEAGGESFMRVYVPLPADKFPGSGLSVIRVETRDGSLVVHLKANSMG